MGGLHECVAQCSLLHSCLPTKLQSIISDSRNSLPPSLSPRRNLDFNLETRWMEPSLDIKSLGLWVVLEYRGGSGEESGKLLLESPGTGNMNEVPEHVYKHGILLEIWDIEYSRREASGGPISTIEFNRNVNTYIRSVFSLTRLLPAFRLQQLATKKVQLVVKVNSANTTERVPYSLEESILGEGTFEPTNILELKRLETPHGYFKIRVRYRKNCKFDLSLDTFSITSMAQPPSSFENVELEAVESASIMNRTPTKAFNYQGHKFGTSLGSLASSVRSRSRSGPNLISPLTKSSMGTPKRSNSSIVEDSILTNFIQSFESRPRLMFPPAGNLPTVSELKERFETFQKLYTFNSRSKLLISPLLEGQEEDDCTKNDHDPIVFKFIE